MHPHVKANYLASPPLVVAYAIAGTVDIDLATEPLGTDSDGQARLPEGHLADACRRSQARSPQCVTPRDVREAVRQRLHRQPDVERRAGAARRAVRLGRRLAPTSRTRRSSTDMTEAPAAVRPITGARCLVSCRRFGHDRPHLARRRIAKDSPAGKYLHRARRARKRDFNSYGVAPRQRPRDDARHVRQHPPARTCSPRRARQDPRAAGRRTSKPARQQVDVDLRRRDELQGGGHAAGRARRARTTAWARQPRLGREGHAAARCAGRHRRELRAHPPLEPGRHGRAAAALREGQNRGVAGARLATETFDIHTAGRRRGSGRAARAR